MSAPERMTARERVKSQEMISDHSGSAGRKTADESASAILRSGSAWGLAIAGAVCLAVVVLLQFVSDDGTSSSGRLLKIALILVSTGAFAISLWHADLRRRELARLVRAMEESARNREAEVVAMREANERAEAARAAKSELFAGIAHELRTPLQGIIGVLRVAADTGAVEERTHLLDAARRSAQSLLGTIGDVLDFTRLEAGRLDLEPVYFSIRLLLADTLEPLGIAAAEKSLTLAYAVAPEVPDRLWGDPGRVRQILVNLTGNAIKFTGSGEIVIRVGCEAIAADGVRVVFEIADTGIGIDPSLRDLLVNPFVASPRRQHGLGLPIVSRLLKAMGGSMTIESEVGKGSTFRVLVPFSCEPIGTETAPEWEKRLAGIRVLLIEPNATTRTILSEIVRAHGMVPEAYDSIERALQPSIRAAYGCLIADANMLATTPWIPPVPVVRIASPLALPVGEGVFVTRPSSERALIQAIGAALGIAEPAIAYTLERRREILRPLRILVVDDNDVNQELIADAARRLGHIVTKTTTAEAPGLLAGKEIDVVVVDVQGEGVDFVQRLRAHEREGRIAAIAVTTNATDEERDRCIAAGFDAVLQTPATQSAIGTILRDVTSPLTPLHVPPESAGSIFDAVGGNANLLMRVRDAFATQIPRLLTAMHEAIEAGDRDALIQAARTLRASISNFDVPEPLAATLQIERAATADDFARAAALLPAIETAIRELQEKIDAAVG
jgi:two-component system, sensor histidine kinase and response regulator